MSCFSKALSKAETSRSCEQKIVPAFLQKPPENLPFSRVFRRFDKKYFLCLSGLWENFQKMLAMVK
ncbi:MAG: hypothetical protein IKW49_07940 [Opitutales bacterium]|nr:hypothetical protein [Opitutales bacterium]